jgi:hypothetical protein
MFSKTLHPSDRLYRGECTSFDDAMDTVIAMCDLEMGQNASYGEHADPKFDAELKAYKASAAQCLQEYREAGYKLADLPIRWRASANPDVAMIGEAAVNDDYSGLAI